MVVGGCDCAAEGPGGRSCTENADCPSGLCVDSICVPPGDAGDGTCPGDGDGDGYGPGCSRGPDCDDTNPTQTGVEVCDGLDNDCDGIADNGVLSPCGDCNLYCEAGGIGRESDSPWDLEGDETDGVGVDPEGALVLDSMQVDTHFIWIANTSEGTVSKVDTRTFVEVARYISGPNGAGNDPSRTSVNSVGDVYVGNRISNTVTKISALGEDCPDTNGDGVVTTSSGPTDVLAWGMDDCVLWNTSVTGGDRIRAVAAQDVEGPDFTIEHYVWIGGWTGLMWKLDGDTGAILVETQSPTNNYGFALDGNGNLWVSGRSDNALGRIDTLRCTDDVSCGGPICDETDDSCVKQRIPIGHNPYGITVDAAQRVWTANHGTNAISRYDPSAPVGSRFTHVNVGQNCHGIAADGEGWVWAACGGAGVYRLDGDDPTMFTPVSGSEGYQAKGMAVDFDGKIWCINRQIDRPSTVIEAGPTLGAATVMTGIAQSPGVNPYTYSDMTGQQLRLATNPRGYYRRFFDGCPGDAGTTGTQWLELRWDAEIPVGTSVAFRVRTADDRATLEAQDWILVAEDPPSSSPADLAMALSDAGVQSGSLLQLEIILTSMRSSSTEIITPRVFSAEVTHECPPRIE